jgi:hypothetical protein
VVLASGFAFLFSGFSSHKAKACNPLVVLAVMPFAQRMAVHCGPGTLAAESIPFVPQIVARIWRDVLPEKEIMYHSHRRTYSARRCGTDNLLSVLLPA